MNFEVHILGVWLILMIIHSLLVDNLGEAYIHLPLYVGLVVAIIIMVRRKWTALPIGISLVIFLLIVLMMLSSLTGLDPENSILKISSYVKGLLLAVLIGGVIKHAEQIKIISLYCLFGIMCGVYEAFRQHITGDYDVNKFDVQRVAGLRGDPNDTAMLLVAGVPLSIYWLTHAKTLYGKLFFIICLSSIIGAITLTGSRGGSVSLLMVMGVFYLKKPSFKGGIIGVLIIVLGLLAAPSNYFDRMGTLVTGEKRASSLKGRSEFVIKGLKVFSDNPLLGVGLGNFGKSINRLHSQSIIRIEPKEYVAHNMYLQFFVENGIFGGVLFLTMLIYPLFSLLRLDKYNEQEVSVYGLGFCMAISLFGMLFAGLFLSQANNSVLWFLIGIGIAASLINMYKIRSNHNLEQFYNVKNKSFRV